MELHRSQRKSSTATTSSTTLPLYRSAPPLEVRLEEFELYAIDRLRGWIFLFPSVLFSNFMLFLFFFFLYFRIWSDFEELWLVTWWHESYIGDFFLLS